MNAALYFDATSAALYFDATGQCVLIAKNIAGGTKKYRRHTCLSLH